MPIKKILIVCCLFLFPKYYSGLESHEKIYIVLDSQSMEIDSVEIISFSERSVDLSLAKRPTPLLQFFHIKQKKNKKLTAALLAFPLPFGIVGLHRIYLGSAPYVPVVYIATFGGILGLLPLIDFCTILLDKNKNMEDFSNNKKVFMWIK